jgi:hypothetical protein
MRKFLLTLALLFAVLPAAAQFNQVTAGPPTHCNPNTLMLDAADNLVYSCGAGTPTTPPTPELVGQAIPTGVTLPLTCTSNPMQVFGLVTAGVTAAYQCSQPNTWTPLGGAGGTGCTGAAINGVLFQIGSSTCTGVSIFSYNPATGVLSVTQVQIPGPWQVKSSIPSVAPAAPGAGYVTQGFDVTGVPCAAIQAAGCQDVLFGTVDTGQGFPATSTGAAGTVSDAALYVDATKFGTADICMAITAAKTYALTYGTGAIIDASGFGRTLAGGATCSSAGCNLACSVSTWVANTAGSMRVLWPNATIHVQPPGLLFPTHEDDIGQGEDGTVFQLCVSGDTYCGGNYYSGGASLFSGGTGLAWSDDGATPNFNASPNFDDRLWFASIYGEQAEGVVCLANYVAQENESGPHFVSVHGCGNHSIPVNIGGANVKVTPGAADLSQSATGSTSCNPCTLSLGNVAAGRAIIAAAQWGTASSAPTLTSLTDSCGNGNYALLLSQTDGAKAFEVGYTTKSNGCTGAVLTFTFSGPVNSFTATQAIVQNNLVGLGTLDQSAVLVASTTNPSCPALTTTVNGDIVFCIASAEAAQSIYAVGTTGGCAASACSLTIGTSIQGWEWLVQPTAGALTAMPFVSGNTHHQFMAALAFSPGTNNNAGCQNCMLDGIDIYFGRGDTVTSDSIGLAVDTGAIGIAGPKTISNVTITCNSGISGSCPNQLMTVDGSDMNIGPVHFENCLVDALGLGENVGVVGLNFTNINGGNMSGCGELVLISNAQPSNGLTFLNTKEASPNLSTNLLVDQLTGCTDPTANEVVLPFYAIGAPGSIAGGLQRLSTSVTSPGCASIFGALLYQIDDGTICAVTAGTGTAHCTNGSLTNPTPGFTAVVTTIPTSTTSVIIQNNGVSADTAFIAQDAPWAGTLLGTTCVQPSVFVPTWGPLILSGGVTPYVPGTTLGSVTVTISNAYASGNYCLVVYFRGYDQLN